MGRQRVGRYPMEFRRMVVERMKRCNNITALAQELGLERKLMYTWREELDAENVPRRTAGYESPVQRNLSRKSVGSNECWQTRHWK